MTNEELVAQIKSHIDEAGNMLLLWQQNAGLIGMIAKRFSAYEEIEDLKQEGYIGLCNAVAAYNPEEGAKFSTYAVFWIRQQMQRYIENCGSCVRIPAHMHDKCRKLKKFEREFNKYYGRKPTEREIGLNLGVSIEQVEEIRNGLKWGNMASTDAFLKEGEDATLGDMIPADVDVENEVLDRIEQEERREALWSLVEELPRQQYEVIRMQYQDNMNLREISERTWLDYNAVRIIKDKGIRTLRRSPKVGYLMPESIQAAAFRSVGNESFQRTWTSSTERAALQNMLFDCEDMSKLPTDLMELRAILRPAKCCGV